MSKTKEKIHTGELYFPGDEEITYFPLLNRGRRIGQILLPLFLFQGRISQGITYRKRQKGKE